MIRRIALVASVVLAHCMLWCTGARAQDVPGIEICTVEKTMERRTSCLQSDVNFLQKTISKLVSDSQQRLDAAHRQSEGLKHAGCLPGGKKKQGCPSREGRGATAGRPGPQGGHEVARCISTSRPGARR